MYKRFVAELEAFADKIANQFGLRENTKYGSSIAVSPSKNVWTVPYSLKFNDDGTITAKGYIFIKTDNDRQIDDIVDYIVLNVKNTDLLITRIITQINDERRRSGIIEVEVMMLLRC